MDNINSDQIQATLTKHSIDNRLAANYQYKIKSRGRSLYNRRQIIETHHLFENNVYRFMIQGTVMYTLDIGYNHDGELTNIRCSCPYGSKCKHEVAALLYLRDMSLAKIEEKSKPINRHVQKNQLTGTYREICEYDDDRVQEKIESLKPPLATLFNTSTMEHEIQSDNTFISRIQQKSSYYYYEAELDPSNYVEFGIVGDCLASRCTYCDEDLPTLCEHQYYVLSDFIKHFEYGLNPELFIYKNRLKEFSKIVKTSEKAIELAYKIIFEGDVFSAKLKLPGFCPGSKGVNEVNEKLSDIILPSTLADRDFLRIRSEELKKNWMNGLVWKCYDMNKGTKPILIQAKGNKLKNQLISKFGHAKYPKYASEEHRIFYKSLFDHIDKNMDLPDSIFIESNLHYLKSNLNALNEVKHLVLQSYPSTEHNGSIKLRKSELQTFVFQDSPARLYIKVDENEVFYHFNFFVKLETSIYPLDDNLIWGPYFMIVGNSAYFYQSAATKTMIEALAASQAMIFDKHSIESMRETILLFRSQYEIDYPADIFDKELILKGGSKQIYLAEEGQFILFYSYIKYNDNVKWNILSNTNDAENGPVGQLLIPDKEKIDKFISFLESSHEHLSAEYCAQKYYFLPVEEVTHKSWFLDFFEKCQLQDIEIFGQEGLANFKYNGHKARVTTSIKSGIDWFDVEVDMSFGDQKVSPNAWLEAVKSGSKYVKLDDGTLGILPDKWYADLKKLAQVSFLEKDGIKLSKLHFNVVDMLFSEISDDDLAQELLAKRKRISSFTSIKKYKLPKAIKADVRPYQLQGYNWLKFLDEFDFGGCLADDMGLGKTLQVICLLADVVQRKKSGTHLIVIPRSLLFNWQDELEKFAPSLSFIIHHGLDRNTDVKKLKKPNIIITTYGTATNDIELLRSITFEYIVLDESQAIKNPASKRYRAMRLLKSRNKLVMTGTPIENNTFDLFAQFSFINPGIFGSQKNFKGSFSDPIDVNGDENTLRFLKKIIHPFMLRRTKEQVAPELPAKSENILYCEMEPTQSSMYNALKNEIKLGLTKKIEADGVNKSKILILDGLLKLRQLCNSPLLLDPSLSSTKGASAKINVLVDHLQNIGEHNALVFSQFVGMLTLIKDALEQKNIKYAYLDGSTRNRRQAVDDFQLDEDCKVFLISIRAGNTGLNLVKADYVYIIDPWWNPAVEAQAIDRTHRIGQNKHVFAYKMVCKDSIEEKIIQLQEKKKKLATDLIQTDDNVFKSLTKTELMDLFN